MTLTEMHVWFRQYAQQMGMQNVRAILPEQIDMLINTSISDMINQLIRENIGITNDRIITDNSKLGQINALRTLYKVIELPMLEASEYGLLGQPFMWFSAENKNTGKMTNKHNGTNVSDTKKVPDFLYLIDCALNYRVVTRGYLGRWVADHVGLVVGDSESLVTNYFPVRIIDDAYLADTLNDFVLKNRIRTPILVIYNKDNFDLYIDKFIAKPTGTTSSDPVVYTLENDLVPYMFRLSYLAKPTRVQYLEDMGGTNVDCDLPESMHIDILKHAVDLYKISISGNLYAAQQQQQNQNREMTRNNARPDNEGYQN